MLDMSQTAGAMRLGLAVGVAGAVCFFSTAVEGLAVGYGHACVVLDNGSVKVRRVASGSLLRRRLRWVKPVSSGAFSVLAPPDKNAGGAPTTVVSPTSHSSRHPLTFFFGTNMRFFPVTVSLQCFGQNQYGQLGQGDTLARGANASTMGDSLGSVDLGSGVTVVAMSAGSDHTCAILGDGSMKVIYKG